MKKIYLPDIVGKGYSEFWNDRHRYRVLKGGKGSKKSTTTALNFIYRLMKYPDSNLLVVRAVFNTHKDSTFAQLKWAIYTLGVESLWQCTISPLEMTYKPTGQKILFKGFDDWQKLASTTVSKGYLNFVWIEEAFEIMSEQDFEKLDFSVPRSKVKEPLFNQTTITFNPWSESHWLKKRFFNTKSPLVSTYSTNFLCNEHLTPEYIKSMQELKERNYKRYEVIGLGNWGLMSGLIYENWETLEFDYKNLGAEDGTEWQYKFLQGLDFGYTNDPTAFIAIAVNPISKEIYIYDEHYETKMLNSDIAAMLKRKGYAKERIRADCAEPKSIDDLRRMGITRIVPSVKGKDSILNGIAYVQEFKIYVHPRCENTIKELGSYCWETDKSENGINKPSDENNHLMDSLRYSLYDLRFFRPVDPKDKPHVRPDRSNITADDMNGSWS